MLRKRRICGRGHDRSADAHVVRLIHQAESYGQPRQACVVVLNTLPPLQFRLLSDQEHGFAGTFGSGYRWAADLSDGRESTDPLVQWSGVHEIQVASWVLSDSEALPVVVAHEVSHLVLERDGVDAGSPGQNEVLTDVATALIGYGILMRRLRSRERRFFGPGIRLGWSISGPGYLLPEELNYILARQSQLLREEQGGTAASSEVAT
jgi:hypothetical protein